MIFNMSTGGASTADKVKYNNTESGLQSTDVQGAIDEVNSSLTEMKNDEWSEEITLNSYVSYRYNKKQILLNVSAEVTLSPWESTIIGQLPEEIRPPFDIVFDGLIAGNTHEYRKGCITVHSNGNISVVAWEDALSGLVAPIGAIIIPRK